MVGFAKKEDMGAVCSLWKECFGDTEEYINSFLNTHPNAGQILINKQGDELAAMMFLLEGQCVFSGSARSAYYIYAACTAPKYRRRGFMTGLVDLAGEYAQKQGGSFLVLKPATEELFSYYGRHGFRRAFKIKRITFSRRILTAIAHDGVALQSLSAQELEIIRTRSMVSSDYFAWGGDHIACALSENLLSGGINFLGDGFYAIGEQNEDTLLIRELCCGSKGFYAAASLILNNSDALEFTFELPVGFPITADNFQIVYNGMIRPLNRDAESLAFKADSPYLGLTLG